MVVLGDDGEVGIGDEGWRGIGDDEEVGIGDEGRSGIGVCIDDVFMQC